jgi:hypothetical protein
MKKYKDFEKDGQLDVENIEWSKYKIVVPTMEDKLTLMDAFEHIHYSNIDTDNIPVNQLAHEYLDENNIIVDEVLYLKLNETNFLD